MIMKKQVDCIFSDKYVNHKAVVGNIVMLWMYRFAYPFSVLLSKLSLNPNQITTLSLAFSILTFLALMFDKGWGLFAALWGMTVLLDFCDGTVARMDKKIGKSAFRYDHMSDLFKITLVILGIGIHFNEMVIWVVSLTSIFSFLFYTLLNHELSFVEKITAANDVEKLKTIDVTVIKKTNPKSAIRQYLKRIVGDGVLKKFIVSVLNISMTLNGHTLLLFFLLPLGIGWAFSVLAYFAILSFTCAYGKINALKGYLKC